LLSSLRIVPILRAAFWLAFVFAVTMALMPHAPNLIEIGDKYQHFLAFAALTALAAISYPETPLLRLGERLSFFGALIEVGQSIPGLNRDCDIKDWIVDTLAILLVISIFAVVRRQRIV